MIAGATAPAPTQSGHSARTQIIPEHRHCPDRLLCCPSVLCPLPALACHIYGPLSSGMLPRSHSALAAIPASSFLFIMTGKPPVPVENFDRGSVSDYFVCLHSVKGHAFIFSISLSLCLCLSPPGFSSPFIKQRLANSKAHTSRFISANLPCNKFKNRLVNIMPFESTRVCLQPIRGVEGSDYINASCIDGYRSAKDSFFRAESRWLS